MVDIDPTQHWIGPNPAVEAAMAAAAEAKKQAESDKLYEHVRRLTEGRADELSHDPVQAQIRKFLGGVINGKNAPFSESVVNALQGQQAHGAATAQQAQMETLRQGLGASGGSIYDPGYQAAVRESDATRQGQNMDYAGQLRAQSALENFNAQGNAAKSLGALNQNQNAQINQLNMAGAGFRNQRFMEHATPGVLMPQYDPRMQQTDAPRQNEGQVDNKFATGSADWISRGFTAQGFGKPGSAQTPQTPENNPNLAGPPQPGTGQAYFFGPNFQDYSKQQQPVAPTQPSAFGGYNQYGPNAVMPSDPLAILRALTQRNQA